MTRGEILAVLSEYIDELWDGRSWSFALLSEKPMEAYQKGVEQAALAEDAEQVDELEQEHQSWLRAVK